MSARRATERCTYRSARAAFDGVEGFRELRFQPCRRETVNDYNRREPREVEPDVDAWVELYFESAELMQRAFERPQLGELFDDHPNCMQCDTPANIRVYHVDETLIHAAPQQLGLEQALRGTGQRAHSSIGPLRGRPCAACSTVARYRAERWQQAVWRVIAVEDPADAGPHSRAHDRTSPRSTWR
jgi:hypothetical protein